MTVKTRDELKSENATDFPDNSTRLISPADLRGQMDDVVDSMLMDQDIAGLDLSEAVVTAPGDGTKTLADWTADIVAGSGGSGGGAVVELLDFIPAAEHAAILAGTSTYNASAAMAEAIASVSVNTTTFNVGGPEILLPYGKVHFDSTDPAEEDRYPERSRHRTSGRLWHYSGICR